MGLLKFVTETVSSSKIWIHKQYSLGCFWVTCDAFTANFCLPVTCDLDLFELTLQYPFTLKSRSRGSWKYSSPPEKFLNTAKNKAYNISGPPAKVVLADDSPPSISSSTPDNPVITNHTPPLSTNSTALVSINQPLHVQTQSRTASGTTGSSLQFYNGAPTTVPQVLGRRNRSPDALEQENSIQEHKLEPVVYQTTLHETADQHRSKRRRHSARMILEENSCNTNNSLQPLSTFSEVAIHDTYDHPPQSNPVHGMNISDITKSCADRKLKDPYFGHDREEVVRILLQALSDLGYEGSAHNLCLESGFELESPTVALFRNAIIQGNWTQAEKLLFGECSVPGLTLQTGADKKVMQFWLRQQKYLELLEKRDTGGALMVLRLELTPLYQDTEKLHFLSSLLMCQSVEELKAKAEWDGAEGRSRINLLSELSKCVSPSVILPEHRLAVLLQQVKETQISHCLYHNTLSSPSLYQDHICERGQFPCRSVIELGMHRGEVWQVKFSNDGTRIASCGQDGTCLIFEVQNFELLFTLEIPDAGICSIAWSPDDSIIVTCANDKYATLWNTSTGIIKRKLPKFGEPVSSCSWAPDGQTFVTGCLDKERNLCQWGLNGQLIYDWGQTHRIQDLSVSPNGHYLVALDNETNIYVYNFMTRELEYQLDFKYRMGSVCISQNSRYFLVNKLNGEAKMIDLDTRATVAEFKCGEEGGTYVIRSSFGGANESFVLVGSEGGFIYIWHKDSGRLIEKIKSHKIGCCTAVTWNPTNPFMFATAGDDAKVRIWGN
ncbi:hypothetical protein K3495_g1778 [Podosphaera aphanis]|nr:hypothetical protein K3495_g1778 [Podosphaera aphanis]